MSDEQQNEEQQAEDRLSESFVNAEDAAEILPAWFLPQMMEEGGLYAVMLSTGATLAVERVERLHLAADGSLWLDVMLYPRPDFTSDRQGDLLYGTATKLDASINCRHVVAVYERGRATDD